MSIQETQEYCLLQHIKFCLECKNESQAIRLIEQYGFDKQEEMYSEQEAFNMLMDFWKEERPGFKTNPVCVSNWFEQFKKK